MNFFNENRGLLLSDMDYLVPCSTHPVSFNRQKKKIHSLILEIINRCLANLNYSSWVLIQSPKLHPMFHVILQLNTMIFVGNIIYYHYLALKSNLTQELSI
jgi:hypothetical protein